MSYGIFLRVFLFLILTSSLQAETRKSAFITGITGQDGSYLAEFLIEKGYCVHGLIRRSSTNNLERIQHLCDDKNLKNRFFLHEGDLADSASIYKALEIAKPDEIYNLAAMSDVKASFDMAEYTAEVDAVGVIRLLEGVRKVCPKARFYQASTSELYGKVEETPQNEKTPFHPRSPYAVAKLFGYWAVVNYREAYNIYACNGILFNHESPRRGEMFVSRKITLAVAKIKQGHLDKLVLGNLDAKRDWGYAKDYVEAMWMILQQDQPEDFVLGTGKTTSVRRFAEMAFKEVGIEITWEGKGVNEKGVDKKTGKVLVVVSPEYYRPAEVDLLLSDASKLRTKVGWNPRVALSDLVHIMVEADMQKVKAETKL